MQQRRVLAHLYTGVAALAIVTCKGMETVAPPPSEIHLTISPSADTLLPNATAVLIYTAHDQSGNVVTVAGTPTWTSSNTNVAHVSSTGAVRGGTPGTA